MTEVDERSTLVVLFGGAGAPAEHTTSCVSAAALAGAVDPDHHDVVAVGITQQGRWVRTDTAHTVVGPGGAPALRAVGPQIDPAQLLLSTDEQPVVVFPLVNEIRASGPSVALLCEVLDVACVGADSVGSNLARDKSMTRTIAASIEIAQPAWTAVSPDSSLGSVHTAVHQDLGGYPVFVKPAHFGYSVGITKARSDSDLADSLDAAFAWDDVVLVEAAVSGRELEVAVIGYEEPRTSVAVEVIPRSEFYTFEDKTAADGAQMVIPADLPTPVADELARSARRICEVTRCLGTARVDFFYDEGGRGLVFNEVNNVPALTHRSMVPRAWAASGTTMPELVDELIRIAMARHGSHRRVRMGERSRELSV